MAIFYDTSTLGTSANQLTFNNFKGSPLFRVQTFFATKRQIREYDVVLPEESGVADFETFIGKEYLIVTGKMYPANENEYNIGREMLRKVSSLNVAQSDPNSDDGYVPFKWNEEVPKQLFVKVLYVDLPQNVKLGFIQPFTLICKIKYPVIYGQNTQSGQLTLGGAQNYSSGFIAPETWPLKVGSNSSGQVTVPFVLPVVLGTSAGTGSISLNNTGDAETYPTIVINGPINKPRILNSVTGEYIELNTSLPTTSSSAIIAYDQDSLSITANGSNAYGLLTTGSTLFTIKPGPAVFTLSGASVGTGASLTVNFLPAWPLS